MLFAAPVWVALCASTAASQHNVGGVFLLARAVEKLRDIFEAQVGVDFEQQRGGDSTEYRSVSDECSNDVERCSDPSQTLDTVASIGVESGLCALVGWSLWGLVTAVEIVVCIVAIGPMLWHSTLERLTSVAVWVGFAVRGHSNSPVPKVAESTPDVTPSPTSASVDGEVSIDDFTQVPRDLYDVLFQAGKQAQERGSHRLLDDHGRKHLVRSDTLYRSGHAVRRCPSLLTVVPTPLVLPPEAATLAATPIVETATERVRVTELTATQAKPPVTAQTLSGSTSPAHLQVTTPWCSRPLARFTAEEPLVRQRRHASDSAVADSHVAVQQDLHHVVSCWSPLRLIFGLVSRVAKPTQATSY
eukprot:CAMPEP_0194486550 /NCGR_PEP_ID=MMETSP0253-20130528/7148_1 /TAXON_ID=2966 /ORGANISM="Noctiluca scintillans" /LENGTH=358 /DNA_ID=CAMNT_0039326647 /DNA_START=49 /DNA_END=1125 /DNA_ORIENTATION=-